MQGAATSVYSATASDLNGKSGSYLEDCKIAQPSARAQDAELAQRLWTVTEQQLNEAIDVASKRAKRLGTLQSP